MCQCTFTSRGPVYSSTAQKGKRFQGMMHDEGYVPNMKLVLHRKKKRSFILCHHSKEWAMHLGSSIHLLVLHSANPSICRYVVTATHNHEVHCKDSCKRNHIEGCQCCYCCILLGYEIRWESFSSILVIW
jgi:hypothetical protein